MRLENIGTGYFLYSLDIKYGYGSGQHCVTAHPEEEDPNSLWYLKEGHNQPPKNRDEVVKCGDVVRFEHVQTGRNVHSHAIRSHIAPNWEEVSAFGEGGNGDNGDNLRIQCDYKGSGQEILG